MEVKYNEKIKKHEMTIIRKANANGAVLTDADTKKRFVKVPFESLKEEARLIRGFAFFFCSRNCHGISGNMLA